MADRSTVEKLLSEADSDARELANPTDNRGSTALHYASEAGNIELAGLLIAHDADLDHGGEFGPPINHAPRVGRADMVDFLIDRGAEFSWDTLADPSDQVVPAGCLTCEEGTPRI